MDTDCGQLQIITGDYFDITCGTSGPKYHKLREERKNKLENNYIISSVEAAMYVATKGFYVLA